MNGRIEMSLREKLLATKPKVAPFEYEGETYYIRDLSVGENNQIIYGQREHLIKLALAQCKELNLDDEDELQKQLQNIYDPNALPRGIALRLCDENGVNLFNPDSEEDLKLISKLGGGIFDAVNKAIMGLNPKNSPTGASSK